MDCSGAQTPLNPIYTCHTAVKFHNIHYYWYLIRSKKKLFESLVISWANGPLNSDRVKYFFLFQWIKHVNSPHPPKSFRPIQYRLHRRSLQTLITAVHICNTYKVLQLDGRISVFTETKSEVNKIELLHLYINMNTYFSSEKDFQNSIWRSLLWHTVRNNS